MTYAALKLADRMLADSLLIGESRGADGGSGREDLQAPSTVRSVEPAPHLSVDLRGTGRAHCAGRCPLSVLRERISTR